LVAALADRGTDGRGVVQFLGKALKDPHPVGEVVPCTLGGVGDVYAGVHLGRPVLGRPPAHPLFLALLQDQLEFLFGQLDLRRHLLVQDLGGVLQFPRLRVVPLDLPGDVAAQDGLPELGAAALERVAYDEVVPVARQEQQVVAAVHPPVRNHGDLSQTVQGPQPPHRFSQGVLVHRVAAEQFIVYGDAVVVYQQSHHHLHLVVLVVLGEAEEPQLPPLGALEAVGGHIVAGHVVLPGRPFPEEPPQMPYQLALVFAKHVQHGIHDLQRQRRRAGMAFLVRGAGADAVGVDAPAGHQVPDRLAQL